MGQTSTHKILKATHRSCLQCEMVKPCQIFPKKINEFESSLFFNFEDHGLVANLFAKNGANFTINNNDGQSLIHLASYYGECST